MNEFLFFVTVVFNFCGILLFYRFFGKIGLFSWVAFASIIANIEALKCVTIFGLSLTLGNVMYGTIFLATDILSEQYGGKTARKAVMIGFAATLVFTLASQITLLYVPNESDFASPAMQTLFSILPRMIIASMLTYIVSNTIDTYLYDAIRRKLPSDRFLWVRNNGSTCISQMLDTVVFTFAAFWGMFPNRVLFELCLTTYVIKLLIAVCDTPFLYIAKRINSNK